MKKYIVLLFFGALVLSACEKEDIFNYELPTGSFSGKVLYADDNTLVSNMYLLFTNNDNGALDMTYSKDDGTFMIGRMAAGSYTVLLINDSLIAAEPLSVLELGDGELKQMEDVRVEVAPLPIMTFGSGAVVEVTTSAIRLRTEVEAYGGYVLERGYYYLPSADLRDITEFGTKKSISTSSDPWDFDFYEDQITGLDPETEYRFKPYVRVYRGLTETGSNKIMYVYSADEILITTLPTPLP